MSNPLFISNKLHKIILSNPTGALYEDKLLKRIEILSNTKMFQASLYTQKQVFHKNLELDDIESFVVQFFGTVFTQCNAWDEENEYSARLSKKGKLLSTNKPIKQPIKPSLSHGFNRQKNHILKEGIFIPALIDMGVFTKENKVSATMWDKFHQINRFLEIIDDETKNLSPETTINVIDFGCGKSYLTFLIYYYFTEIKKHATNIIGLDLNIDVIDKCNQAAKKYQYTNLHFARGDISNQNAPSLETWKKPNTCNIVISLHACDTATDHVIYNAIRWNADLIYTVPCCQHELNQQMKPKHLKLFAEYGLIKERIAALTTDMLRAKLMECCGYKVHVIEFTAFEHTAKNIMLRARKLNKDMRNVHAMHHEIQKIIDEFAYSPTLLSLLSNDEKMRPKI